MSTYKIIEVEGSSYVSWDDAAKSAILAVADTLEDLSVGEVTRMNIKIEQDGRIQFSATLKLSFKVHSFQKYAESLGPKPYAQESE